MFYTSYFSPFKPWVWLTMLNSCENNYNAIIQDYAKSYKSFQMNSIYTFLVGAGYCALFFTSSIYSFRWNNKG
ncbi:hypothetical protein [Mesoplasma corruscae]|uniref:hypothetical protein n=1 Tax=Mesoplasma corruscae TaxID=216874 RepID=UPI000CE5A6E7|nr:hypothetical protein [Mesoplasma corruscae]